MLFKKIGQVSFHLDRFLLLVKGSHPGKGIDRKPTVMKRDARLL